MDGAVNP